MKEPSRRTIAFRKNCWIYFLLTSVVLGIACAVLAFLYFSPKENKFKNLPNRLLENTPFALRCPTTVSGEYMNNADIYLPNGDIIYGALVDPQTEDGSRPLPASTRPYNRVTDPFQLKLSGRNDIYRMILNQIEYLDWEPIGIFKSESKVNLDGGEYDLYIMKSFATDRMLVQNCGGFFPYSTIEQGSFFPPQNVNFLLVSIRPH